MLIESMCAEYIFLFKNKILNLQKRGNIMIKLIATDMDGTLLNAAHEISQPNIDAIKYAQEQGITVVIATGRAFYEAQAPVADTDLTVPYICLNGAEST